LLYMWPPYEKNSSFAAVSVLCFQLFRSLC